MFVRACYVNVKQAIALGGEIPLWYFRVYNTVGTSEKYIVYTMIAFTYISATAAAAAATVSGKRNKLIHLRFVHLNVISLMMYK